MISIAHSPSASGSLARSTPTGDGASPRKMPSRIHKDQCLAGPFSRENGTPIAEPTDGLPALRMALYIDKHRLVRDCISEQLASHLSQWTVESLATMSELKRQGALPTESVVVLHAHSASVAAPEVTSEIALIAEAAPGVPFVVMSDLEDATEALLAIRSGARGFLPASLPLSQVIAVIRFVAEGGTYIPACVLSSAPQRTTPVQPVDAAGNPIRFSPRQQQVLDRLRQGKQSKIIAYELGMCESTVKVHLRQIMKKLNARNRTQVVLLTNNMDNGPEAKLAA
jgi:DNA-binding NarL/FixJ family response regulator